MASACLVLCLAFLLMLIVIAISECSRVRPSKDNHITWDYMPQMWNNVKIMSDEVQRVSDNKQLLERMKDIERLLLAYDDKFRDYDVKLSAQERLVRKHGEKLLQQELLIRQQAEKVTEQANKISALEHRLGQNDSSPQLWNKCLNANESRPFEEDRHKNHKRPSAIELINTEQNVESNVTSRDLRTRADDSGPLEVVLSQLSQQVTEMKADVQALKTSHSQQTLDIQDARTSTFVHWGSSSCATASQLVYSGVVGGSHYTDSGAATNYLCLTLSPVFIDIDDIGTGAYLHGGEYHSGYNTNPDAVCAVCRSQYSSTLMVPGTNVCSLGWHLQYSGYLMAGRHDHVAGSEYICVDSKLETFPHTESSQNGNLLYYTITNCSSLPCDPFKDNKVVLCAVCSK